MFISLDIKTANKDPSSICEIGIGIFENDKLVTTSRQYIDPKTSFDLFFTDNIHGITSELVSGLSSFESVYDEIRELLINNIVVHHSQRVCLGFQKAIEKYDLKQYPIFWLDSEIVAEITWKEFPEEIYTLEELTGFFGIEIGYPHALNCAIAVGKIVIEACKKSGIGISELLDRVRKV